MAKDKKPGKGKKAKSVEDDDSVYEYLNLRFVAVNHQRGNGSDMWVVDVSRISDGHSLSPQIRGFEGDPRGHLGVLAEQWMRDKLGCNEPAKTHCRKCGKTLVSNWDTDYQFEDALWVYFKGGYGMFVDTFPGEEAKAVLCQTCAQELCKDNPWIAELLLGDY